MIPYNIIPMFHIGFLHINMYGIMFALGALVATLLAAHIAKKRGINKEVIYDLALYMLVGGIIGARLVYVIFYWPADVPLGFFDIFKIWQGGIAFFGGLIGGILALYIYTRKHKLNFWVYADIFTVPLIAGHILGRFGDYFTGGHPGKVTNLPWAIYMDNALRHPVVLYEILGLLAILAIVSALMKKGLFDGFVFASYTMLYSAQRIVLDYFRIESTDPRFLGLTPSQFISIALLIAAICFIAIKLKGLNFRAKKQAII